MTAPESARASGTFAQADADALAQGFSIIAHYLLEAEADCICGALRHHRSAGRANYRCGYHKRKVLTRVGEITLRVPHLRYIYMRPSLPKRINRLSDFIIATLTLTRSQGVTAASVSALIRALWTLDLHDERLDPLVKQASGILELWLLHTGAKPATYSVY